MLGLSLLSGCLWALAFPLWSFWFVAPLALIPLLYGILAYSQSSKQVFFWTFLTALTAMIPIFSWILPLKTWVPLPYIILLWVVFSAYQALFYSSGLFLWRLLYTKRSDIFFLPVFWCAAELLRSFGPVGSTGGVLGIPMVSCLPVLQLASVFGMFGVSFLVVCVNVWFVYLLTGFHKKVFFWGAGLALVMSLFGFFHLNAIKKEDFSSIKVAIIQGNHSQQEKLNIFSGQSIKKLYLSLSESVIHDYKPDLIVWPETFTPDINLYDSGFVKTLQHLSEKNNLSFLFGTPTLRNGQFFNSAVLLSNKKTVLYDKWKLMPFGEYWPMRALLQKMGVVQVDGTSDFSPGSGATLLKESHFSIAPLICLESVYPAVTRAYMEKNAPDFLVIISNNAWFFNSNAADQHHQFAQFRAVESGRYVVHATNTGISALISPIGKTLAKTHQDERAVLVGRIEKKTGSTGYTFLGESWLYLGILVVAGVYLKRLLPNRV